MSPADLVSGRSAIAGIGQTTYAKNLGRTELDLACEAIIAACDDAGFAVPKIDGVVSYHIEQVSEEAIVATLGIENCSFMARTTSGGGGAASVIGLAAMAVASGQAESVVAFRARNRSKGASYGTDPNQGGRPWEKVGTGVTDGRQWHNPFGVAAPAQEMALIARRHMAQFGTTAEQFGMQAVAQRFHASRNPHAIMRTPIDLDDWRAARMIADPIRLVDCSLENDGATAVLVTTVERARDLAQPVVTVLAQAMGAGPIHVALADYFRTSSSFDERDHAGRHVARQVFARAGLTPADVDVAMFFDHFTMAVPLSLEQYGFCGLGEGGPMIESGATRWPDGALPVNTHGGSNGEAFIHGVNHVPEAVRQLRGTSTCQVDGAEVALVTGAITDPAGAVLLGRG
ncbi:MAG: thiolase C-terminal domain-containing protein [Actinomycetota bacterium]